ncbi:MAG TPA: S-adenosylmethionine decarboxylase [Phycisphaerae bacterium]|nr:S-adenosylmethionine decarboxylase [Phycisphaerae bacterium]
MNVANGSVPQRSSAELGAKEELRMQAGDVSDEGIFGWELVLDLYECDQSIITSRKGLLEFVKGICRELDLRPYAEPWAQRFGFSRGRTAGYTVVQLMEVSSVVGHFSEQSGSAYLNIFSCKPFDRTAIAEYCKDYLGSGRVQERFLVRR